MERVSGVTRADRITSVPRTEARALAKRRPPSPTPFLVSFNAGGRGGGNKQMKSNSKLLAVAAGSIAVIGIWGCRKDDEAGTATRDFLARGNAICHKAQKDIERGTRQDLPTDHSSPVEALNELARELIIPRRDRQIRALRRLSVPPGEGANVKEILDAMQAALDESKRQPFRFTLAKDSPFAKPDRLVRNYGLTDCVSG